MAKIQTLTRHPLSTWLALLLLAVLISCTKKESARDDKLQVVTTFTVIADMASNVGGDAATVLSVTKAGAEIHNYQPTPKDIAQIFGTAGRCTECCCQ